jgi:hypothetical protein
MTAETKFFNAQELSAAQVIELLDLSPHPEGGFFRETFRSPTSEGQRGHKTAIYFLLPAGQRSHWHRVDAAEMWHFYAGAPLLLRTAPAKSLKQEGEETPAVEERILGGDLVDGQRPQLLVAEGDWQSAESLGRWTLVGCTVAPAFEFEGFEMAPADFEP